MVFNCSVDKILIITLQQSRFGTTCPRLNQFRSTVSWEFRTTVSWRLRTVSWRFRIISWRLRTVSWRLSIGIRTVSWRLRTVSWGLKTISLGLRKTVSWMLRTTVKNMAYLVILTICAATVCKQFTYKLVKETSLNLPCKLPNDHQL